MADAPVARSARAPSTSRVRRASIRLRVTAGALVAVAIALAGGAAGVVWMLDRLLVATAAEQLSDELVALADGLDAGTIQAAALTARDDDVLVALRTETGVVVNADAAEALPVPSDAAPVVVDLGAESYVVVAAELAGGTLVVARSTAEIDDAVGATARLLLVAVPIAIVVIGTITWIVVDRSLAPVERIRRQVARVDASSLDHRVPTTGNGDELDRLAGTMNGMLDRVEAGTRARQRFVSDASHELRSPLATMRQFAELSRAHPEATPPGELAQVVLEEGERMHGIVEALLLLARLDEHAVAQRGLVDLDDLALAEAERVRALGVRVDAAAVRAAPVAGDARLLARAMRNLVDNAVRHASAGIAIGSVVRDGRAMAWVDDDGAGVPAAERDRVFERFVRLDEGRARDEGGSGLGLAIVREVARVHGGDAWIATSPAGGARFVVELPTASAG